MGAGAPRAEELLEQLRAERREREGEGQQLLQVLQQRERHRGLAQLAQEEDRVEQVRARHRLVLLPVRAAVGPLDAAPRLRHRLELRRAARHVAPQDAVHLLQAELDQRVERVRALEDVLARAALALVVAEAHRRAERADHLLQRRRLLRAQQLLPPRRDHRAGHRDGVGGRRRRRRRLLGVVEGVAADFLVLHFALHLALALLLLRRHAASAVVVSAVDTQPLPQQPHAFAALSTGLRSLHYSPPVYGLMLSRSELPADAVAAEADSLSLRRTCGEGWCGEYVR